MKRAFVIILISILVCTGCVKKNTKSLEEVTIDKNVTSQTLLENLDRYVVYDGDIDENNKKLTLLFSFKKGVNVPKNPPYIEAKVYLWMDSKLVGIYTKPLYHNYKDYLKPVVLTFTADGKPFNHYKVSFNANSAE